MVYGCCSVEGLVVAQWGVGWEVKGLRPFQRLSKLNGYGLRMVGMVGREWGLGIWKVR